MTNMNCEYVREIYPDILHGRAARTLITAHIASCDECRADIAVLDDLYARPIAVPAGLETRTITAVRSRKTPRWYVGKSELLMAATLAATLIGGSAIMQLQTNNAARRPTPAASRQTPALGAAGVEDALAGKSSLEDLSVEQLQKLLGEMES